MGPLDCATRFIIFREMTCARVQENYYFQTQSALLYFFDECLFLDDNFNVYAIEKLFS